MKTQVARKTLEKAAKNRDMSSGRPASKPLTSAGKSMVKTTCAAIDGCTIKFPGVVNKT